MALSSLSGRRAVGRLLLLPQRQRQPGAAAAALASSGGASQAPIRAPWARSYWWHGARAASSSSSSISSSSSPLLLLHAPSSRRDERNGSSKHQPALSRLATQAGMGMGASGTLLGPQSMQARALHATRRQENVVVAGLLVAGTALTLQYGLRAYNEYKAKKAAEAAAGGGTGESASGGGGMSALFAKRFYEGGFEEKMTRREAALILGVRESASPQRIKEAHRRILMLNHPDTGGSTYIASKINEAKEMLLKGKT